MIWTSNVSIFTQIKCSTLHNIIIQEFYLVMVSMPNSTTFYLTQNTMNFVTQKLQIDIFSIFENKQFLVGDFF